jgi:hypothetical protein
MKTFVKFFGAFLLVTILFSTATSNAQGKVNFSGTWAINEAKSTPSEGGPRMASSLMTITQDGNNLSSESTRAGMDGQETKSTVKFTLDGKESTNPAGFGNSTRKSTVTWSADGKTLNFAHVMKFDREGETMEFKSTETWTLTDEKTLSVTTVMNFNDQEMKNTAVYNKK